MNDIIASYAGMEFRLELFEGTGRVFLLRLDFYGENLIFQLAVVRKDKIDFDVVTVQLVIVMGVEIQFMPGGDQHLRDHILIEHPFIERQLPEKDLPIKLAVRNFIFVKGVADQQAGVAHVTFHVGTVFVQRQADVRVGTVETFVGDHRIGEPEKGVMIFGERGSLLDLAHDDPALRLGQKGGHAFRHPPHDHVLAEQQHRLGMEALLQRFAVPETRTDICSHLPFAHRPGKFFDNGRFADSAGALDKQGFRSVYRAFPIQQPVVYFTLEYLHLSLVLNETTPKITLKKYNTQLSTPHFTLQCAPFAPRFYPTMRTFPTELPVTPLYAQRRLRGVLSLLYRKGGRKAGQLPGKTVASIFIINKLKNKQV